MQVVRLGCMTSLTDIWPPYAVRITEGDLVLAVVRDDDVPGLVDLALSGIHPPDRMPFSTPWTQAEPAVLPANMYRYFCGTRAAFGPGGFSLQLAVRCAGRLVGTQGFDASDFSLTRTGETGSWLGQAFQGNGIGTRMRQAVCAFAFDELGATEITSGAFVDNPASLAVSRKVGYQPNGVVRLKRGDGDVQANQKLVLTAATFVRGPAITVEGAAVLRQFLGLDALGS